EWPGKRDSWVFLRDSRKERTGGGGHTHTRARTRTGSEGVIVKDEAMELTKSSIRFRGTRAC
ncbi:MAG: hypothetical protein ABSB28_11950, partial [Candidatus Bathyarchaeia archaeon]